MNQILVAVVVVAAAAVVVEAKAKVKRRVLIMKINRAALYMQHGNIKPTALVMNPPLAMMKLIVKMTIMICIM